jgi:N-acetyl-anhydromuramyl-L-alanine amidase AmpD
MVKFIILFFIMSAMAQARPKMQFIECEHFNFGRRGVEVDSIIYHYTAGTSEAASIINSWNRTDRPRLSSHYLIDRNGDITSCVDELDTAWHAWTWNAQSIGIEIVADYPGSPSDTMTGYQKKSLVWLTKDIMTRHRIRFITGHRFTGTATSCPGNVFPTEKSIDNFLTSNSIYGVNK